MNPLAVLLASLASSVEGLKVAKTYPDDPTWPNQAEWQLLNTTIEGNLVEPSLPAQACYGRSATQQQCRDQSRVHAFNESTLVETPWWSNFSCPATFSPDTASCSMGNYPAYVVRATKSEHVAAGVRFAKQHNIRLVVKNTGHDFLGRNLGYGSLSIWTHHLQGAGLTDDWRGTGQSAITISSGMQWRDVYHAVSAAKKLIVGGTTNTVGAAGGWLVGGGHSALSNLHGLGCDQVLEFEAVVPSTGEIVIVNATQNADLFWALRGGGGSTFAIVTKATMKTHPQTPLNSVQINMMSGSTGQKGLIKASAYLMSKAGEMTAFGLSGYPVLRRSGYGSYFMAPNKTFAEIDEYWKPLIGKLESFGVNIYESRITSERNLEFFNTGVLPNFPGGGKSFGNVVQASRLIGRRGLEDVDRLENIITTLLKANYVLEPFIFGGQVMRNKYLDIGLNPAWRDSVMHLSILPGDGDDATTVDAVRKVYEDMQAKHVPLIDAISVDSGAYWNEASYAEPEWKKVFFGTNYARLLEVKKKYDPHNTLWCHPCVGGDELVLGVDSKLYLNG